MGDDEPDVVAITRERAIVAREALDHMVRYKDHYDHAMSVDALLDARDEIDDARSDGGGR